MEQLRHALGICLPREVSPSGVGVMRKICVPVVAVVSLGIKCVVAIPFFETPIRIAQVTKGQWVSELVHVGVLRTGEHDNSVYEYSNKSLSLCRGFHGRILI